VHPTGFEGALTIAFTAMDRILEIDTENFVAVVQPGVTLALSMARIGRFVAGSDLLAAMEAALEELWPQAGDSG